MLLTREAESEEFKGRLARTNEENGKSIPEGQSAPGGSFALWFRDLRGSPEAGVVVRKCGASGFVQEVSPRHALSWSWLATTSVRLVLVLP